MTTIKSHKDMYIEAANKRLYAKRYYHRNKDKTRKYYQDNKEKIKKRAAAWRLANRERYLEQQKNYDATRRGTAKLKKGLQEGIREGKLTITPKSDTYLGLNR